ncbi:hypothetical protein P8452_43769 [Trifolium repens]|nr:hypothetical protein P8452_43769 [Trifolium repens]
MLKMMDDCNPHAHAMFATQAIVKDPPMVCETDADCITSWDPNFDIKCIENKCEWARKILSIWSKCQ